MAAELRDCFSPAMVRRLGASLVAASPRFAVTEFVARAGRGLGPLTLMARAQHIADAMAAALPAPFPDAVAIVLRSLPPAQPADADEAVGDGLGPFFLLPHTLLVAAHGQAHFAEAMAAQHALTQRFSCEFSIRPFLRAAPERTLAVLRGWASDPSAHVRRLVSEGTRLRLPWGQRVPWLDAHPAEVFALLEHLRDDPSAMVRRSVANSLGDLARVVPADVVATCARWQRGASPARAQLIRHALRSLVKRGDPAALALVGATAGAEVELAGAQLTPARPRIGEQVRLRATLQSRGDAPQTLVIDYAVHFVKASGAPRPKVFKLRRVELAAGAAVELAATLSLAQRTTRRHYPGPHAVELRVNGRALPLGTFQLRA